MFYERFKYLCDISNTTPTQVLKQLNISTSKGTAWKKGSEPSSKYVVLISDFFKVSADYLLGRTEKPNSVTQVNTGDVGNHSNVNISSDQTSKYDKTTLQVADIFQDLDVLDKAKVLNLIAELSDKEGE